MDDEILAVLLDLEKRVYQLEKQIKELTAKLPSDPFCVKCTMNLNYVARHGDSLFCMRCYDGLERRYL